MVAEIPGFPGIPDISQLATVSEPVSDPTEVLTAEELAAYWGVTPQSIKRAAWKGEIPGCVRVLGKYVFDKEVVLDNWVPPSVQSWATDLNLPEVPIAGGSGLTIEGGRKAIRDAAIARLHDLHILVTSKKWTRIVMKAVDQATEGDWRARKWLGDYLMGPPTRRVEAEVVVKDSRSFSDEMRAQAVEALLSQAGRRTVIDVSSRSVDESTKPDANREVPT